MTMKTLNHGAKMTAARTASEIVRIMEYGMTMLGGTNPRIDHYVGGEQWMTIRYLLSTSMLEEFHSSTCQRVRGAATAGITNLIHDDVADVFTKPLSLQQCFSLMSRFWIFKPRGDYLSSLEGKESDTTDMNIFCRPCKSKSGRAF